MGPLSKNFNGIFCIEVISMIFIYYDCRVIWICFAKLLIYLFTGIITNYFNRATFIRTIRIYKIKTPSIEVVHWNKAIK